MLLFLAVAVLLFDLTIFAGFVTAVVVARRLDPFDKCAPALMTLLIAIVVVGWFLLRGAK